jgi:hypothetical protein
MTEADKIFIESTIKEVFDKYQHTKMLRINPSDNIKLKDIYFREYGRNLTGCSVCVVEAIQNLINKANGH